MSDTAATSEQDTTVPPELEASLAELVRSTEALRYWGNLPWQDVQHTARTVAPQLLEQLVGRGLWDKLSPAHQALVHWAAADAYSVSCVQEKPNTLFVGPRIESLCMAADNVAVWCGAYGYPRVSKASSAKAEEFLARFDALPAGWRVEVIRRASAGRNIQTVVGEAPIGMNLLRSAYGIDVRTP